MVQMRRTVRELAEAVGGWVHGDGETIVTRVASLADAGTDAIAFVEKRELLTAAMASRAACLIVPTGATFDGRCCIEVAHPKLAFAIVAEILHRRPNLEGAIHPTAIVSPSAHVAPDAHIGAHVHIGERAHIGSRSVVHAGAKVGDDCIIGDDCILHPNVVIYERVTLGSRVILHAGAILGADGFGYVRDAAGEYHKFPQIGIVVIEDDVEIGAGTCVDRGALGETRIGAGTKIDNLVQVGHNVRIGKRVVIAAQTGISGSCVIEDDCVIGGQVGIGDHVRIERGAIVGSKAGILPGKIVRGGGAVYWGVPVRPLDEYKRLNAHLGRLPQMREELQRLQREVAELTARLAEGEQ